LARINRTLGFSTIELLIVVAVSLIIAGMAIPMIAPALANYRLVGDARSIASELALARMRAASNFTKAEVAFDLVNNRYQIQVWNKNVTPQAFQPEGGVQYLAQADTFPCDQGICGAASQLTMTPAGSQTTSFAQQTPAIIFNSRGICVDINGGPITRDAIYISNVQGSAYLAVTVNIAGQPQVWKWDGANWNLM
jgi:Tfp pilus assembly protein FimT